MTKSFDKLFIGGEWVAPSTQDTIEVISPYTEQVIASVPSAGEKDMDAAVASARNAFDNSDWPTRPLAERLEIVRAFLAEYQRRIEDLAVVQTEEMGAAITGSTMMVGAAGIAIQSYLNVAESFPWVTERKGAYGGGARVRCDPIGVVAAIAPWNSPQFLLMSKLAPSLIAGCTVIAKPAPETPVDALMLGEIAEAAGLPAGVLSVLPADRPASEYLVGHPGVDKIAFTGSTGAGRTIGALAGRGLKKVNLELGGKSAAIVLEDADLDAVAQGLAGIALGNSGQICTSQNRIVVVRERYDDTVQVLTALAESLVIGDPMDEATTLGPVVAERQRDRIRDYIRIGQDEGARLVTGGAEAPKGFERGWFVRPTVFAEVQNSSRIAQEEIFGPVLSIIPVADEAEAIAVANDSNYGLSGSVWTADQDRGLAVAGKIRTGSIGVNQSNTVDPAIPFGGAKDSGVGTEFGPEGLSQYLRYTSIFHN